MIKTILDFIEKLNSKLIRIFLEPFRLVKNWFKNKNFQISNELDGTEVFKTSMAAVGAIIVFVVITLKLYDLEVYKMRLELAKEIPKLYPVLNNYYTNQATKDGKAIQLRVVVNTGSTYPVYIHAPKISLYRKNDPNKTPISKECYSTLDRKQFRGPYPPSSSYEITYNIDLKDGVTPSDLGIEVIYKAETPKVISSLYKKIYHDMDVDIGSIFSLNHRYRKEVYEYGANKKWDDFFKNPS